MDLLVSIFIVIAIVALLEFILMQYRNSKHYDGQIIITTDKDGKKTFMLELDKNPYEIEGVKTITFKVVGEHKDEGFDDML